MTKVWFVTGASSGIGAAVVDAALAGGDVVAAAFRAADAANAFDARSEQAVGLVADVRDREQVDAAVARAVEHGDRLDVVVNCAGYGLVGAVEELSDDELRDQVDVNLFGTQRVIRAALPTFRAQRRGVVVNVSSVAGRVGYPGMGAYDASKGGVELLSEALALEVGPLGVSVVVVEPGNIRTDWAGRSMRRAERVIDDYATTAGASRDFFAELDGHQIGDAAVVAGAILDAVDGAPAPGEVHRLVVGSDSHEWIADHVNAEVRELDEWVPSSDDGTQG
ncbi:MAG TPA: SDR family NAD(P)-dependent oxidoreductase [Acidimicrobiia bacterium]|jgi:NAD(P)-dependent dehydrogenase (short-subunit alcohol dehydrogenase family)